MIKKERERERKKKREQATTCREYHRSAFYLNCSIFFRSFYLNLYIYIFGAAEWNEIRVVKKWIEVIFCGIKFFKVQFKNCFKSLQFFFFLRKLSLE